MNSDGKSGDRSQFTFRNCATSTDKAVLKKTANARQVSTRGDSKIPDLAVVRASPMAAI